MKAIMISDKPRWCALMMNGYKTIEVRKNKALASAVRKLIDEYGYAEIYVYCSKDDKNILFFQYTDYGDDGEAYYDIAPLKELSIDKEDILNGKVVFKFRCYKVEEIKNNLAMRFFTESASEKELLEKSCLNGDQLFWYLAPQELKVKCCGYSIHISNLEIFDKPKELNEFMTLQEYEKYQKALEKAWKDDGEISTRIYEGIANEWECANAVELTEMTKWCYGLTKAPQNFCYLEVE